MIQVKRGKLQEGMVLAEDINGMNNLQLKSKTVLSDRYINIINNKILFTLEEIPITDESYNIHLLKFADELKDNALISKKEFSETYVEKLQINKVDDENYKINNDLSNINDEINIPGNLIISGDVINCSSIFISGQLVILGNVKNSNIIVKSDITIQGDINNDKKDYRINSFGKINVNNIDNVIINTDLIRVKESIKNSEVSAEKIIEGPAAGCIQNSELRAGSNIIIGNVRQGTLLIISSKKQGQLFKKLMDVEKKLDGFDKEIEPLQQSINIFKILKNQINELPEEKRKELISNIKLVRAKVEKKKFLNQQSSILKVQVKKLQDSRKNNPIIVEEEVEKGTKVIIDNSTFEVTMKGRGVVFYKKGMIIMGKKDKEWGTLM